MICKNCNRENNDNANFCAFCGKELDKKDRSKIDLKKDEDVVYFDPYDDEEVDFEDYDYEEDEEEVQNFEFKQDDEKETLLLMRRLESLGYGASNGATAFARAGESQSGELRYDSFLVGAG